jgi:membrane-associated phospholipid phosphatase
MPLALADYRLPLDLAAFQLLNRDGGPWLDGAARVLSSHAFGVAAGLALALLVWGSLGRAALRPVLALGLAVGLADALGSQILRPLVARARPCYALPHSGVRWLLPAADVGSLPSLHAANLFALALVATLADRRLAPLAYAAATGVALSRVYGGVHWPSDVVAGAAWGTLCGAAAWAVAQRAFRRPEGRRAA